MYKTVEDKNCLISVDLSLLESMTVFNYYLLLYNSSIEQLSGKPYQSLINLQFIFILLFLALIFLPESTQIIYYV